MTARRLSPPDGGSGTATHTLYFDGTRRVYWVHVPPILPLGAPLLIQLHGGGGNGAGIDRLTRFYALADRERFAVVSPDGHDRHWSDGRIPSAVDDVGFIAAVIDCLAGSLPLDRRRVYAAGISNGAMMVARLANELSDRVAAFAQVAGTAAADAATWWRPPRPVPLIQIHGTADPIVPYAGGAVRTRGRAMADRGRVLGVDEWAALVAAHNGATPDAVEAVAPDVTTRSWRGSSPRGDVQFWRVEGGGHTWPGGIQYLPARTIGPTTAGFDATDTIWRFLSRHQLGT